MEEGAEKVSYELDNPLEPSTSASVPPPFTKELSAEASIGRISHFRNGFCWIQGSLAALEAGTSVCGQSNKILQLLTISTFYIELRKTLNI